MEFPKANVNWTDWHEFCNTCRKSNGTCFLDSASCFCPNLNITFDSANCSSASQTGPCGTCFRSSEIAGSCIGKLCTTTAKVAGLGVPSVAVVALIAVIAVYFLRRRRILFTKIVPNGSSRSTVSSERAQSLSSHFSTLITKEFSMQELQQATACFSDDRMVGDGGFGAVYAGRLMDGRRVAVKRLFHTHFRRMEVFLNELRILSSLNHPNLVKLYGFCCEDERDLLLVFEYVTNGPMSDHLHNGNGRGLPWNLRLNIALETADALSFLHNSVIPPILHRDVKSTNILLDENFHAKLADFGLSRLVPPEVSHISTAPQGTPGYLDPDYHQCYQLTDKSDVYSFGVVLMELVTAKLAVDMSRDRREINLAQMAMAKILSGTWHELVDPRLQMHRDLAVENMVKSVVELAFRCLAGEKDERPKMRDVAEELARIKKSGCLLGNARQTSIDIDNMSANGTCPLMKQGASYSLNSVQSP